jgi:copper resistance protein B
MIGLTFSRAIAVTCVLAVGAVAGSAEAQHAGHPTPPPKQPKEKEQPAKPQPQKPPAEDHSAHMAEKEKAAQQPKEPIPPLTDADRAAAFPPDLHGHAVHDRVVNYMLLFDQVEWQGAGDGGATWENTTWVGGDLNRLWLRTEGESENGRLENFFVDALWGRPFSRWWDFVAGVRQDIRPGDPQTWVGAGVQGLAPYWFELEATGMSAPAVGRTPGWKSNMSCSSRIA